MTKTIVRIAAVLCMGGAIAFPVSAAMASPLDTPRTPTAETGCFHVTHENGRADADREPLTPGKYAVVVNSDNPRGTQGNLVVLDQTTHKVVESVDGLGRLPNAVAVQCDGSRAYVANFADNSISVVDLADRAVIATVKVGEAPDQVSLSSDGRYAYVVNTGTITTAGSISVLDTATNTVINTIPAGFNPYRMVLAGRGPWAYVVADNAVRLLNLTTGRTKATLSNPDTNGLFVSLALAPDGKHLYAIDSAAAKVRTIDTQTFSLAPGTTPIPGYGMPDNVAIGPSGSTLYITESGSTDLAVIDLATPTRTHTVTVGRNATNIALTEGGEQAYITSSLDDTRGLTILDTASSQITTHINTGSGPFDVALLATE